MRSRKYTDTWPCPYCGYRSDATSGLQDAGDELPDTGDISLCLACGKVAGFVSVVGTLTLQVLPADQLAAVLADPRMVLTLETWRQVRAKVLLRGDRWPG